MTRRLLGLAALLVVAGCQSDPPAPASESAASESGPVLAPDFTLPTLDGEPFTLSEHRGDVVVLNFWATWCLPCLAEIPEFIQLQDDLADQGVQFVGVSQDEGGLRDVRPFAERFAFNYPLVADSTLDVSARFGGVPILPTTIVIDREGAIHRSEFGALTRPMLLDMLGDLIDPEQLPTPAPELG